MTNLFIALSDLNSETNGSIGAWYRNIDNSFDTVNFDTQGSSGSTINYGAEGYWDVNQRLEVSGRINVVDRLTEESIELGLQSRYSVTDLLGLAVEYQRDEDTNDSQTFTTDQLGVRADLQVNDKLLLSLNGQLEIGDSDNMNSLYGVAVDYRFNSELGLNGEYFDGELGDSIRAGIDYQYNENSTAFLNFLTESETSRNEQLSIGQSSRLTDKLSVYQEQRFDNDSNTRSRGQVYGLDYLLRKGWTVSAETLVSRIANGSGRFDRQTYSLSSSYRNGGIKLVNRVEKRTDEEVDGSGTTEQWVFANRFEAKLSDSLRLKSRFDFNSNEINNFGEARFGEIDIGIAYRPTDNDRLNLLASYSYLYDIDPTQQNIDTGRADNYFDERSHVLSIDAVYDLNKRIELSTKLAIKTGEISTSRVTSLDNVFLDSNTSLVVLRGRIRLLTKWDLLTEIRRLEVSTAQDSLSGFLGAIEYDVSKYMKIGAGYNFSSFNDDLTDLDFDARGWFINLIGKY